MPVDKFIGGLRDQIEALKNESSAIKREERIGIISTVIQMKEDEQGGVFDEHQQAVIDEAVAAICDGFDSPSGVLDYLRYVKSWEDGNNLPDAVDARLSNTFEQQNSLDVARQAGLLKFDKDGDGWEMSPLGHRMLAHLDAGGAASAQHGAEFIIHKSGDRDLSGAPDDSAKVVSLFGAREM